MEKNFLFCPIAGQYNRQPSDDAIFRCTVKERSTAAAIAMHLFDILCRFSAVCCCIFVRMMSARHGMRERKYRRLHLGRIRGSVVISAPHTSACISHDSPVLEPAMRRMFSTALDGGCRVQA